MRRRQYAIVAHSVNGRATKPRQNHPADIPFEKLKRMRDCLYFFFFCINLHPSYLAPSSPTVAIPTKPTRPLSHPNCLRAPLPHPSLSSPLHLFRSNWSRWYPQVLVAETSPSSVCCKKAMRTTSSIVAVGHPLSTQRSGSGHGTPS